MERINRSIRNNKTNKPNQPKKLNILTTCKTGISTTKKIA